jgi:hypothetical protein
MTGMREATLAVYRLIPRDHQVKCTMFTEYCAGAHGGAVPAPTSARTAMAISRTALPTAFAMDSVV